MTSSKNSHKGTFNEIKTCIYLDSDLIEYPLNWNDILSTFSPSTLDHENNRAHGMAQRISNYVKNELGWDKISKIYWTRAKQLPTDDMHLKKYILNTNPSDIVLISDEGEYLGVSLKSYTKRSHVNHKQTSFFSIDPNLEIPSSRDTAHAMFGDLITDDSLSVVENIIHLADPNYINVSAKGAYDKTRYELSKGFSDLSSVKFRADKPNNKFDLEINHEHGTQNAVVYFKRASTTTPDSPKYAIQVNFTKTDSSLPTSIPLMVKATQTPPEVFEYI